MPLRPWLLSLFSLLCPFAVAHGQAYEAAADARSLSPYFVVEGGDAVFTLEATHVQAKVNGVIADVKVEQTYYNQSLTPIHAHYVFPASGRAAVHGMRIRVGDKAVVAKIRERKAAEREFEAARESGKTASLLAQERPNVFSMSVANILPGDHVVVELNYSELLVPDEGVYEFVYPTVVGPRYAAAATKDEFVAMPYMHAGEDPDPAFTLEVELSTGVPIAEIRSSTHALKVEHSEPALARVSLDGDQGCANNRDFILDYRLAGAEIQSGLLLYEGPDEKHFLLMVQPPARVAPEQIAPREYVFVLDVSGSMSGFPLDTAKILMQALISRLRPSDSFNMLLFSGDSRLMAERSLPATQANIDHAFSMLAAAGGGGATELEAALRRVTRLPRNEHVSRSVVVLTDGYIAEERGAFELIAENADNTNVFAFGIGSSVNRYLIDGLARVGQGEPFVVTKPADAATAAERFARYIEAPVLTEVRVHFQGFDAYAIEPTKQADLFAQRPLLVFGKWRGPRAGEIEVTGRTPSGPWKKSLSVAGTPARAQNEALPQLWARTRIARLSDFDTSGESEDSQREVTQLGLKYSLLTKHTSFIAVLEQIRNPGGQGTHVQEPQPLPLGVSDAAVGGDYRGGDEPELLLLTVLVLSGFAWFGWRRSSRKLWI